jgi:predicted RNA polymerase sigma factor
MDQLSDQYRLALEWKYVDQLSVREIAVRFGLTEKAAESILFRARRELREQLVKESPSPASSGNGKPNRVAEPMPHDEREDAVHKSN